MRLYWLAALVGGEAEPASCPEGPRVPVEEIDGWLAEAEDAFAALDIERFLARSDQVRAALPCVDRVVPVPVVARLHRAEGLRRFGERRVDSVRAFAAARALDPEHVFDPRIAPPGHPILDDYAAMDLSARDPERLAPPARGRLYVDGIRTRERARALPAVVQVAGPGGDALMTAWVEHHEPVPAYPVRPRARLAIGAATAAAAATSGVALGAALGTRTEGLYAVSAVGAVCTATLGTAMVVTW